MKQNDIFRLALQAGFKEGDLSLFPILLMKFADLVAAEVGIAQWHRGFSEGQSVERAVCAKELRRLHALNQELLEALNQIIEMNRATARDQFGDGEQAERWACVVVARAAIAKAEGKA